MWVEAHGIIVRANGTAILSGIDLTLEPGQMVGVIGPNGAGKTTLITVLRDTHDRALYVLPWTRQSSN